MNLSDASTNKAVRRAAAHRGAGGNPPNRFDEFHIEPDAGWDPEQDPLPRTQFLKDHSGTIISYNDSPDIPFETSLNPYRGCEHGCVYCYARPTHEYLGFSAGLDFETRIMVKEDAPKLLRAELSSPRWKPKVISLSGVTDPYQPIERRLKLTRACLEVLAEFRNPVTVVTKNNLVMRDLDFLSELARHHAAAVFISVTTLDGKLRNIMEPRTTPLRGRLTAIHALAEAGVPVGVMVAPIIPGLTDHEIPSIVEAARNSGAEFACHEILRLPLAVAPLFEQWLLIHLPQQKERVLNRIRTMRGGKLNDPRFGVRMRGEGIFAEQISGMFRTICRRVGLVEESPELSVEAFRRSRGRQMELGLSGSGSHGE